MAQDIFNIQQPHTLTTAQQLQNIANQITGANTQLLNVLVRNVLNNYDAVWNQSDQVNLNAQAIMNVFGVNAGALVANFGAIATLVNNALVARGFSPKIPTTYPNGQTVTVNSDGTVTVNAGS